MISKCDATIILDTVDPWKTWCVYEHLAQLEAAKPPVVVLVGACKLHDLTRLTDGRRNSEWLRLFANGGSVMIRIVATTDIPVEARALAATHMRTYDPMPRCNLHGYSTKNSSTSIREETTGQVYSSQSAAGAALGISGSAISRHLRGDLKHVGGYVFRYVNND